MKLLLFIQIVAFYVLAQPVERRRGFSGFLGDYFTCDDAKALNMSDSWYYTWTLHPSQGSKCRYQGYWGTDQAAEFVPMVNGIGQAQKMIANGQLTQIYAKGNVQYILGYNEPDGTKPSHPHACTPEAAAKDWVYVQRFAESYNAKLVSPAPSGNDWSDDGRSKWLDKFFEECEKVQGCNTDSMEYIGVHDYSGDLNRLISMMEGIVKNYGRKAWLTEYAWIRTPAPTREEANKFMRSTLDFMDTSDAVFRYVWFTARCQEKKWGGCMNLLPYDSTSKTPTSTGRIWGDLDGENYPYPKTNQTQMLREE